MFKKPGETTVSLDRKIVSGLLAGAIGITVANVRERPAFACGVAVFLAHCHGAQPDAPSHPPLGPPSSSPLLPPQPTDLVKVRMQSEGRLAPGQAPRYRGVGDAYRSIVRAEGVRGLWTGLGPAVLRNSVINATELASYETAKEALVYQAGVADGLPAHFAAGAAAGLMATIVGNPVDVIKTRVMAARRAAEAGGAGAAASAGAGAGAGAAAAAAPSPVYRGALDCAVQTVRGEGVRALYQGVVPQFYRLTGWSIVMFVTFEKVKAVAADALAV
jgi:solute carrier family 25 (mitochondrial uncoupling protein), member 8/9